VVYAQVEQIVEFVAVVDDGRGLGRAHPNLQTERDAWSRLVQQRGLRLLEPGLVRALRLSQDPALLGGSQGQPGQECERHSLHTNVLEPAQ
jgi:hypothetical protein